MARPVETTVTLETQVTAAEPATVVIAGSQRVVPAARGQLSAAEPKTWAVVPVVGSAVAVAEPVVVVMAFGLEPVEVVAEPGG